MSVLARLQPLLKDSLDRHGLPGASLAVLADGKIHEAAAGVVNTLTGAPSTPDSLFMYGSVTKTLTATMALRLAQEGRIALDDLVSARAPDFDPQDRRLADIRISHLLAHNSGLTGSIFIDTGRNVDAIAKQIPLINAAALYHQPGGLLSYCNCGYVLLGRVFEHVTGATWDQTVQTLFAAPLGATVVTRPEQALRFGAAVGHVIDPATRAWLPIPDPFAMAGHGPAGATVAGRARDLVRMVQGYLDGSLIKAELVREAWRVQAPALASGDLLGWGHGWMIQEWNGKRIIGHDGSTAGTKAYLRVAPDAGVAVALLVNAQAGLPVYEDVFGELFRELVGAWERGAEDMPSAPASALEGCVGAYVDSIARLEVSIENDQAKVTIMLNSANPIHRTPLMSYPVQAYDRNAFYATGSAALLYPPAHHLSVGLVRGSRLITTDEGDFLCSGAIACRRVED